MTQTDDPDDPFDYDTIEIPTVMGLLRNILTQYPDNGQIIKELVQNAEDAGATAVEVVHDARELQCSGAKDVIQRFLKGPALCLFNNSNFTKEDWHGIRKLSDSIKKDDPLKVGQFGLGFKSVFHLTDFVTILSGHKVLFMDPGEPEKHMCRIISLSNLTSICPLEECLHLWSDYLSKQNLTDGYLPATIFWFPLRQSPSEVSGTIYTHSHVERLFESFSVEAPVCLTFLKSLEKISLKIIENEELPTIIHQVELASPSMLEVQQKREDFRKKLKECNGFPAQKVICDYKVTVLSKRGKDLKVQTMWVLHYLPGTSEASSVTWRGKKSNSHMPLVGVAAPLNPHEPSLSQGHIFCFLPLPLESANNTGLPVQINGFFALNQNRRHVNWKTRESSNEPDVMWNEELVSKVIVEAYCTLLRQVLQETATTLCHVEIWYSLLPDLNSTSGRWRELAKELWSRLITQPILYSEVRGCMMMPKEILTDDSLNALPHVSSCVRGVLSDLKFPLAKLPETVLSSLHFLEAAPETVTPKKLRDVLRSERSLKEEWNRKYLLEYVISDQNYNDLEGVPLLPLENGTWIKFSRNDHSVYICKETGVFLGLEAQTLNNDLSSSIIQSLEKIAQTGNEVYVAP
ncbi:sacsin-like, partial [Homarus americanus]|uniref:sacsin-like n=1 Tax=Homarus americanus TaxID=6706 RepID=UPI001C440E5C